MAVSRFIRALVSCLVLARCSHAFSGGGPDSACDSLMPSHEAEPQQGSPPYQVTTTVTRIGPGQIIEVTLSGSRDFTGYFIRPRQNNLFLGGTFQESNNGFLRCNGEGMTHSNPDPKNNVMITWRAPDNLDISPVHFEATFVQQRTTFWTSVTSPSIDVASSPSGGAPSSPSGGAPSSPSGGAPSSPSGGAPSSPSGGASSPSGGAPSSPSGGAPSSPSGGAPSSPSGGAPSSPSGGAPSSPSGGGASSPPEEPRPPTAGTTFSTGSGNSNQESSTGSFSQNANTPPPFGQPAGDTTPPAQNGQNFVPGSGGQPGSFSQNANSPPPFRQPAGDTTPPAQNANNPPPFRQPAGDTTPPAQNANNPPPFRKPAGDTTPPAQNGQNFMPGSGGQPGSFSQNANSPPPFGQPAGDTTPPAQNANIPPPFRQPAGDTTPPAQNANSPPPFRQPAGDTTPPAQNGQNFVPGSGGQPGSFSQNANSPPPFRQPAGDTTPPAQNGQNFVPGTGQRGQPRISEPKNGANSFQNPGSVVVDPECGKSKGCYHNCQSGDACSYVISWSYEKETVQFHFLFKTPSTTDQWIALALSRDTLMGDDNVMECVMENGKVEVKTSYNNGKMNEYTDDKYAGLSDMAGSVKNGVLACSFRRKVMFLKEPRLFDLSLPYHLMVASGEAVAGNKFPHSYEKLPKVSGDKISLQQVDNVSRGLDPFYPMVKTHGTLMTLAWLFFASCGLLVARHGKSMFHNAKPFGIHVWFHIHRFSMVMTALLTVLGFVLILVESQGYSFVPDAPGKSYRTLHPPLGIILVVVTLVNPLMALFRPDAKAPSRPLFNWSHWGFGVFAWSCSFVLIVIGLDLSKSQADVEAIYVVFAFIGYQIVIEIVTRVAPSVLVSLYERFKQGCGRSKNSYDINMTEISTNEASRNETGNAAVSNKELTTKENETFIRRKNVITSATLVAHMLISACFAIAVLYFFLRQPVRSKTSASA